MKSKPRILDAFQIVGFIISVATSLGLIIAQQDTIPSVILGLVLAVFTQLFDLQIRHTNSEERILRAGILNQALYRDEWLFEHIRQIVDDYQSVKGKWFDLFKRRADDAITECRDILHSMKEDWLVVQPRSPYTFGAAAFEKAKKSVKATQVADVSYWRSTYAQKYFQANINAVQRGVKIVRVFIQPLAVLHGIIDILEKQRDAGIEVYVVPAEELPRELNEDYLIIDDRIFTCAELTSDRQSREERISIDPVEVERMVNKFNALLRHAKKLDDAVEDLKQSQEKEA